MEFLDTLKEKRVRGADSHEAASKKNLKMLIVYVFDIMRHFFKWGWFFDNERVYINKATIHKNNQIRSPPTGE